MHALVRDPELPRELSLRGASGISGADEGIALLSGERFVMCILNLLGEHFPGVDRQS